MEKISIARRRLEKKKATVIVKKPDDLPEGFVHPPQGPEFPFQGPNFPAQGAGVPPQDAGIPPQCAGAPPQGSDFPPQDLNFPPQDLNTPPPEQNSLPQGTSSEPQGRPMATWSHRQHLPPMIPQDLSRSGQPNRAPISITGTWPPASNCPSAR